MKDFPDEDLSDVEDDGELYGETYYLERLPEEYGFPSLDERARKDFTDRIIRWLRVLLKYRLPPGKTLDIGAAHGGFVKVLKDAGFEAQGLELSPWLCKYASDLFGIPMLTGPVEKQNLQPASLVAVSMMDVIEHLQDPLGTLSVVQSILEPKGALLVQTPEFRPDLAYADLIESGDRFVEHLKPDEHLYLFSRESVARLMESAGFTNVEFEQAPFDFYDMLVLASREPLQSHPDEEIAAALTKNPDQRLILALLDSQEARKSLEDTLANLSTDNEKRLAVIERQGKDLAEANIMADRLATDIRSLGDVLEGKEAEILHLKRELEHAAKKRGEVERSQEEDQREINILAGKVQALKSHREALERLVHGVNGSRIYTAIRGLGQWRWFQDGLSRYLDLPAFETPKARSSSGSLNIQPGAMPLGIYCQSIDRFNQGQPNTSLLEAIRQHNHTMLDMLQEWHPLGNAIILDAGASPHGYALEYALQLGASFYMGIGLDINEAVRVQTENGQTGVLWHMDATDLKFPDDTFDCVISVSTFEHIHDIDSALKELHRVLRRGGTLFLNFEPVWTSASGHHLHHFGEWSRVVPPWGHLLWDEEQMEAELGPSWPPDATLTIDEAIEWIFQSDAINRLTAQEYRQAFERSDFRVEWLQEIPDETTPETVLREAERELGVPAADLRTRGYFAVLRKA